MVIFQFLITNFICCNQSYFFIFEKRCCKFTKNENPSPKNLNKKKNKKICFFQNNL